MTLDLLKTVRYEGMFSFKYSKRPGTAALKLAGHLPDDVKEERLAIIMDLQKTIAMNINKGYLGTTQEILIDGVSKKGGMLCGRTRGHKVVNVDAPSSLIGTCINVTITACSDNSLTGDMLPESINLHVAANDL